MEYRALGDSGLSVSTLAFGAWQIGDPGYWGTDEQTDAEEAVNAALDAGINIFDTAEGYAEGESERVLGKVLGSRRKDVIIATKVLPNHLEPAKLRASCEASLERLGTDVIDLYQAHWPNRDVPFEDTYAELARLRDEGKIRAIGVSNFGVRDLTDWLSCGPSVSNQLGYGLLFRAIEYEIVPACQQHNVGVLVYMPLLQGLLAGRWWSVEEVPEMRRRTRHFAPTRPGTRHDEPGCEDLLFEALRKIQEVADGLGHPMARVALAWTMAQPGITSVIAGARKPHQLIRNVEATELKLPEDALAQLNAATEPIKQHLGANADMWDSGEKARIH